MLSSILSFFSLDNIMLGAGSPDRLIVALGALISIGLIGYVIGPIAGNANPFIWRVFDKLFGGTARKSYRIERAGNDLAFRGVIFTSLFVIAGIALGIFFYGVKIYFGNNHILELLFLVLVLSGGGVWVSLIKLYRALKEGSKLQTGSFYPIAVSTRTNLNSTDDYGIARIGIGYMPFAFDKGVVAPVFWYLLLGLPGAYAYAAIAAARWALSKEGYAKSFGDFAIHLDAVFGVVPHVIAGLLLQLAALFTPTAAMTKTVSSFFTGKGKANYAEGGLPLNITAWALNVSLGGPVEDHEASVLKRNWVGPEKASARVEKDHLKRAIYMSVIAYVLFAFLLLGGLIAWRHFGVLV